MAWLGNEPHAGAVRDVLAGATAVVASDLTTAECHRAFTRWFAAGRLAQRQVAALRATLTRHAAVWARHAVAGDVLVRAGLPFPIEPVRVLDAIHLATALSIHSEHPDLVMLSLDDRIRRNAAALGITVLPD